MKSHKLGNWNLSALFVFTLLIGGCFAHTPSTSTGNAMPANLPTESNLTPSIIMPSSEKIAFTSLWNGGKGKFDIYVENINGNELKNLTVSLPYSFEPAWSPDGKYIAFTSHPDLIPQIYTMKADGSEPKQLTFDKAGSYSPSWSPDGKYIVFLSARDGLLTDQGNPIQEAYIMKSDGSDQRRITHNQGVLQALSWFGKENYISLSVAGVANYSIETFFVGIDGSVQNQLPRILLDGIPVWSPNSEYAVFAGSCGITVIKADGSNQTCLIENKSSPPVNNISPSWSPNGKYIVFSSNRDGNYNLYTLKTDGSELTKITNMPGDETSPAWVLTP